MGNVTAMADVVSDIKIGILGLSRGRRRKARIFRGLTDSVVLSERKVVRKRRFLDF